MRLVVESGITFCGVLEAKRAYAIAVIRTSGIDDVTPPRGALPNTKPGPPIFQFQNIIVSGFQVAARNDRLQKPCRGGRAPDRVKFGYPL
jgi:hypothetical protein